jgi:hypothetical protein
MIIDSNMAVANNLPAGKAHRRSGSKTVDPAENAAVAAAQTAASKLSVSTENLTAAGSPIQDANEAMKSTEYARASFLAQPGTAILAQANSMPQSALRLLEQ